MRMTESCKLLQRPVTAGIFSLWRHCQIEMAAVTDRRYNRISIFRRCAHSKFSRQQLEDSHFNNYKDNI